MPTPTPFKVFELKTSPKALTRLSHLSKTKPSGYICGGWSPNIDWERSMISCRSRPSSVRVSAAPGGNVWPVSGMKVDASVGATPLRASSNFRR